MNFDADSNGVVSIEELHNALSKIDDGPEQEEVEEFLKETQKNQNGDIDFDEFKKLIDKIFPQEFGQQPQIQKQQTHQILKKQKPLLLKINAPSNPPPIPQKKDPVPDL